MVAAPAAPGRLTILHSDFCILHYSHLMQDIAKLII